MKRYQKFLVYWLINSAVLYLSSILLPDSVKIGNFMFSPYQSILFSAFVWTLMVWYTKVVLKDVEVPLTDKNTKMAAYVAVNFVSIWLIARFAVLTGIGIANYWIVLVIAVAAELVQYLAWQYMDKR